MVGWIFRVTLIGTQATVQQLNLVFQFMLMSGNTPLTFSECVTDLGEVMEEVAGAIAPVQSDTVQWFGYSVARLDGTEVSGIVPFSSAIDGANINDALPSQNALVLRFATGHSRRVLRKFIPGLCINQVDGNGQFLPTPLNALISAGSAWLTPIEATEAAWQYMYKTPNLTIEPQIVFPVAVTAGASAKVMRSRRFLG